MRSHGIENEKVFERGLCEGMISHDMKEVEEAIKKLAEGKKKDFITITMWAQKNLLQQDNSICPHHLCLSSSTPHVTFIHKIKSPYFLKFGEDMYGPW